MAVSRINEAGLNVNQYGNRNIIINGSQIVNQRGTQTLTASATAQFGPDRFKLIAGGNVDNLVATIAQDSDVPSGSGFANSLKITTTTAESAIDAAEYVYLNHTIEAQNLQQLAYGTSSAKEVTLSFWVKSTITGTFAVGLYKPDSTSQIHVKTYTISSASTWEYKTVTFGANALSGGAIVDDNGSGIEVAWHLAVGSNFKGTDTSSGWAGYSSASWGNGQGTDAVITTTNATYQITGVQLEVGDTATDFEHRTFGDELQRCRRYFQKIGNVSGNAYTPLTPYFDAASSSVGYCPIPLIPKMRTVPSFTNSGVGELGLSIGTGTSAVSAAAVQAGQGGEDFIVIKFTSSDTLTQYRPMRVYANNDATAFLAFDSEL